MKKLLSALLSILTVGSLSLPALAAPAVNVTRYLTDLSGAPIDADGKQISGDTVIPGQTIYFMLPGEAGRTLTNTKNFKLSVRKNVNAKLVKSVFLTERKLGSSGTYAVPNGFKLNDPIGNQIATQPSDLQNAVPANTRANYLAVQLNDTPTTEELKVELTATFTARRNAATDYAFSYGTGSTLLPTAGATAGTNPAFLTPALASSADKLNFKLNFYVANPSGTGDSTVTVGAAGVSIKPIRNDYNEVIFDSSTGTMATLSFNANSNPDKFYAKLTTKWTTDLWERFKSTDAVIRRFSPATISSTSRGTLALNNPFDTDAVNPSKVYIYTVTATGALSDITSQTRYNSDEDTFLIPTRTLGTYILSDKKVSLK